MIMKTLHTIYTSFAKRLVMSLIVLMTVGVGSVLGAEFSLTNATIKSSREGKTSYGTYTINEFSGKWLINLNGSTYSLQLGYNTSSSKSAYNSHLAISLPDGANNISVYIKTNNSTASGRTFYACNSNNKGYVNSGDGDYGKGSTSSSNGAATIQISGNPSIVYIYPNGTAYIEYVTVTYDESASCTYTVTFNGNGNTGGSMSAQEFNCGESKALTTNAFTKTGHTFAGWATSANGSVAYTNQQSVTDLTSNGNTITLFAQWTPNKYTVNFTASPNGYGTVSQSSIANVPYGTTVTDNSNEITINGTTVRATPAAKDANYSYSFNNWSNVPNTITGTCTITANFTRTERELTNYRTTCTEPSTFTVTYDENGATSGSVPTGATEYAKDAQVTVLGNTGNLAKTGYTFNGWNTESDGTGASYTAGEEFTIIENTTLYAQWEAIPTYTVTFDSDGGSDVTTQIIEEGETATTPSAPTKVGHTFIGWYNGDTEFDFDTPITGNITLKAKWTINTYTLTWDVNGGNALAGDYTSGSVKYGATITKPADPTRDGYRFDGWSPEPTTMPANNLTYTAQWVKLHTITWMVGSNSVLTEEVANATGVTQTPADPANNAIGNCANAFMGWTETPLGSTEGQSAPADLCTAAQMKSTHTSVTGDKTFYAVFASAEGVSSTNYTKITSDDDLTSGDYVIAYSYNGGTQIVLKNAEKDSKQMKADALSLSGNVYANPSGAYIWHLEEQTGGTYTIYNSTVEKNLYATTSELQLLGTATKYQIAYDDTNSRWTIKLNSSPNYYVHGYVSGTTYDFRVSTSGAGEKYRVYLYKNTSTVTYSNYVTNCCTPWAAPTLSANTSIAVGGTTTITYSGTTYGDVTYTSSNADVATVDADGKVTGVKPGETTITASWDGVDGSGNYCPAEATIDVTVTGSFTITYDANHASATGATTATTIAYPTGQGTVATNGFALAEHQFVKWNTSADGSGTSYSEGASITLTDDTTLYAIWQRYCTITYVIPAGGGTLAAGATATVVAGGAVQMPGIENNSINLEYSCEELIGWTTNSATHEAAGLKPDPFYAIGASLSGINQNTTLYAVYSRPGAGVGGTVTLTEEEMYDWDDAGYGTQRDLTTCVGTWTTTGYKNGSHAIQLNSTYYIKFPELQGNITQVVLNATNGSNATLTSGTFTLKTLDGQTTIASASVNNSGVCTLTVTGSYKTARLYSSATARIANISISYGPAAIISTTLSCTNDIDKCTVTYDLNESFLAVGTQVLGSCTNSTFRFSEIGEYTICSEPQANEYRLIGWNNQCDGKGSLTYTPGQVITSLPQNNLTLYAQWAPVVSLNDAGSVSEVNATTFGGAVALPDGEKGCDPYEFVGWTTEYPSWNEESILPTIVDNPYTPTEPTTLYAVYTQRATSPDFTANCDGGVYEIWEKGHNQHMAGRQNGGGYGFLTTEYWDANNNESNGAPFTITKVADNTYTLQNADGQYITRDSYDGNADELEIEDTWDNLDRYKWTISAGTNGSWRFTNKAATTHALIYYNPYFRLYSASSVTNGSSYYDLELTPVESAVYYSAPSCGDYAIHFYTHGGEFVQGDYAYPTAVKEGLNGTVETKFPSATLNGYTFVGWKENAPQDELTDNSPEGDTSAEPYGLKKPGDDLITTTRREFHAVYYYYDELQDVDLSGPITTSIFAENNAGELRFLSGTPSDNPGTLSSTTACGDVAVVKITPGTGENTGKYTININGYNIIPQSGEAPGVERGTAWWYIEETSTGSGEYKIYVQNGRNIVLQGVSFGHYAYNAQGSYNGDYHYVRFGNCREHHWASDPKRKPSIILSSSGPLTITSAAGQTIKSINKLFVGATHYETQTKIYLTCDVDGVGLLHEDGTALSSDANGEYLTTTAEGELASTNLILTYSPTITTDGIETVTITAQDAGNQATANRLAEVRHLPENFVIAAKVGNLWYALPSQGLNSTDPLVGYPVEVDNQNDPTAVTAVPENADWSLRQVYASSRDLDRFKTGGHNLVFVNNVSPEKALNPSSSSNYLLTNAQYNNYHNATTPGLYEWTPTTTDLETYQLTNVSRTDKQLNIATNTVFGVHETEVVTADVRVLPIQGRYTPAALQVVEWKENSIVIMYNGDPAQTASVSVNGGAAQETVLSSASAQRDIAVYELTATGLAVNPTQRLSITIGTDKVILPIPYIISGSKNDKDILPGTLVADKQEVAKVSDLVILKEATLTAAGASNNLYKFRHVTIYGGGKLVIPSDKGFGVASLTLRAGGIKDAGEYDYVYDYVYPQFELRGTFTNSVAKINYDYITDYDHWFHLVLPFAGDLGTIKYPTEFYGANVAANNTGSWQIKRYAGEIRATGNYEAWVDIETEGETSTIAGKGYIFWGAPKKVSVNGGDTQRQKWGIQRITMSVTAPNAMTAENGDKAISELSSYENVPYNSGKDNDQGWNLIGNPYMVNLKDMATTGLHACKLVEVIDPVTGKPNGKWKWNDETNLRYLTIPSEHFDTYNAKTVSEAISANALVPGRAFFVQLEGAADGITFAAANRASLMPALLAENNDKPVDIETGIVLSNETLQDEVNFWIKDGKTNNYEYNADYPKTPNNNHFNIYGVHTNGDLSWVATSPEYAAQSMPIGYQVPAAGTYTLSVSETYYSENLQALFVTDHEASPEVTTNLVDEDYTFYVNQAETNNTRFTVSIILKPDKENTPTGVDNIDTKGKQPIKFLYQDKIYILRNGMIYDTTGKQVITINK